MFTEKPGKPGVPEITNTERNKISLKWKAPKSDGGSPIFNYVIEHKAEGAFKWVRANLDNVAETTFTVKGLQEDTIYEFRVSAENQAGVGPYSECTMPIKAQEVVGEYAQNEWPQICVVLAEGCHYMFMY